jgi:hypothetical protein
MKVLAVVWALIATIFLITASLASELGSPPVEPLRPVIPAPEPKRVETVESPLAPYPVLKAVAEVGTLPAVATPITPCPLAHFRGKKLSYFALNVKNMSDDVAIIDGDSSQAEVSAAAVGTTSAAVLIQGASQNLTPKGKVLLGAATIGSLGLAGVILLEKMTPDQHNRRDPGRSIGLDGVRHDLEAGRFGRRLLMPGDETTGWLAFECADGDAVKALKVPIWFSPMRAPPSYLSVPIKAQARL